MAEIENIFDQSDSDSFNESSDLEQSDEEFFNDPLSDKGELQNENDEEYIELESDNDSEIIPRRKRRTRCLSSSDSESSREKLDEWIWEEKENVKCYYNQSLFVLRVFRELNPKRCTANLWTNSLWCLLAPAPSYHPSAVWKPSTSHGTSLFPTRESAINLLRNGREVSGSDSYSTSCAHRLRMVSRSTHFIPIGCPKGRVGLAETRQIERARETPLDRRGTDEERQWLAAVEGKRARESDKNQVKGNDRDERRTCGVVCGSKQRRN
ncbi:hypothetical protein WH47_06005 [Habropoda laboriosa]|uniref:Uncharacterized protein n=1 Tax=Habropoda laboriosa TaxID=597456 RepID=A0A0L7RF50_9HYME|nr:hypothetical protein WH47_06005 [Habropoda laboriosa]